MAARKKTATALLARSSEPDDVRAQILAAAVKCMEEGGLADVSMREVARRAGVSHQLPYHYFTDREGILAAVAQAGFDLLRERFKKAVKIDGTGADKLAAAGRAYVEFACDHPAHFRVMFRQDFVAMEKHADAQASADSCFAQLPVMIMEAIEDGLPPHPNPQALVVMGWSIAHGLACLLLDGPLAKKIPEAAGAREKTVNDVMEAMRFLLASSTQPKKRR